MDIPHIDIRRTKPLPKLIRDNIPKQIAARKGQFTICTVSGGTLIDFLCQKLREETTELEDAFNLDNDKDREIQVLEELADLATVVAALAKKLGFSEDDLQEAIAHKKEKNGGFDTGTVLVSLGTQS